MNALKIITILLICVGAATMFLATFSAKNILQLIKEKKNYKAWKVLKFLINFFLVGYLASAGLVLFGKENILIILIGIVSFFAALFVFTLVRIGFITINDYNTAEIEIKKLNGVLEQKINERTIELTNAVENLSKSEIKYSKMVEEVGDLVYTLDCQGFFTYVNPACIKLTGYAQNEIVGKKFLELTAPEWKQRVDEFYSDQFKNRINETTFSFPIITKSGGQKWVEQTVATLREGDKITGQRSIMRDISERKKTEDLLEKSNKFLFYFFHESSLHSFRLIKLEDLCRYKFLRLWQLSKLYEFF